MDSWATTIQVIRERLGLQDDADSQIIVETIERYRIALEQIDHSAGDIPFDDLRAIASNALEATPR